MLGYFIPVMCLECGERISRKSVTNPGVICTSCEAEFRMVRINKCLK